MADFSTWRYENLVKFAQEANERLKILDSEVKALSEDLKIAIKAYRELNTSLPLK
jgi:hypothetical protein